MRDIPCTISNDDTGLLGQLDDLWSPRLPASREGTRWLGVLKTLVAYRLIDPGRRLHRQWYERSAMGDLLGADFALAHSGRTSKSCSTI